uniref:Uncharacterized protein n=1 Tax=Amphimedon queenslandica TaxID=400682 RepID=A0A1X7U058_AMPQE
MKIPKKQNQKVRLNVLCDGDVLWWQEFLLAWNGISFFPRGPLRPMIYSDSSGCWECEAFVSRFAEWLQVQWSASSMDVPIAGKKLVPIVAGFAVQCSIWSGGSVQIYCDNMAVMQRLNAGSAREPLFNHLRVFVMLLAHLEVSLLADHIAGVQNSEADALSRNNAPLFFSICPQALRSPTVVPELIKIVFLGREGFWALKAWMTRQGHCLPRACLSAHGARTLSGKRGTCPSVPDQT